MTTLELIYKFLFLCRFCLIEREQAVILYEFVANMPLVRNIDGTSAFTPDNAVEIVSAILQSMGLSNIKAMMVSFTLIDLVLQAELSLMGNSGNSPDELISSGFPFSLN